MLIELGEVGKLAVAQGTLEGDPIPRAVGCAVGGRRGQGGSTATVGDHLGLDRDDPFAVPLGDIVVIMAQVIPDLQVPDSMWETTAEGVTCLRGQKGHS